MTKNKSKIEFYPAALTIAGSDSGGGAGIQADLRTFNAFGVFGCTAITAVTAQNPREVTRVDVIPPEGVRAQIDAVMAAIAVKYAKSGMLANAAIVNAVADALEKYHLHLIADPVMVATSGAVLLEPAAVDAVRTRLLPKAAWITPNLPEAELLLGCKLKTPRDYRNAAQECHVKFGASVLLKTGHAPEGKFAVDYVCRENKLYALSSPRLPETKASHGTGCTLSSALTAALAMNMPWKQALCEAKAFVLGSLHEAVEIGSDVTAMYPPVEDFLNAVRLEAL